MQVKAFTYGSVPLKTYLPDGDIDLAIFQNKRSPQQLRDTWFIQLSNFLQREEHNPTAYFRVREAHVIHAEVRHNCLLLITCNSQKDNRTQQQHRILVRGTATGLLSCTVTAFPNSSCRLFDCSTWAHAMQVKLVKCLVDNIVVDISFQSLGGLCTVNFLESIDRRIDDHHLFKRSIILV